MEPRLLLATPSPSEISPLIAAGYNLATALGRDVVVLHVVTSERLEVLKADRPPDARFHDVLLGQLADDLRAHIETLVTERGPKVEVRFVEGDPANGVLQALEHGAWECVVIGVRSRSRVGKLLLGSTAQQILLQAPCPVYSVRI